MLNKKNAPHKVQHTQAGNATIPSIYAPWKAPTAVRIKIGSRTWNEAVETAGEGKWRMNHSVV